MSVLAGSNFSLQTVLSEGVRKEIEKCVLVNEANEFRLEMSVDISCKTGFYQYFKTKTK